jgi:hypothetical protein
MVLAVLGKGAVTGAAVLCAAQLLLLTDGG